MHRSALCEACFSFLTFDNDLLLADKTTSFSQSTQPRDVDNLAVRTASDSPRRCRSPAPSPSPPSRPRSLPVAPESPPPRLQSPSFVRAAVGSLIQRTTTPNVAAFQRMVNSHLKSPNKLRMDGAPATPPEYAKWGGSEVTPRWERKWEMGREVEDVLEYGAFSSYDRRSGHKRGGREGTPSPTRSAAPRSRLPPLPPPPVWGWGENDDAMPRREEKWESGRLVELDLELGLVRWSNRVWRDRGGGAPAPSTIPTPRPRPLHPLPSRPAVRLSHPLPSRSVIRDPTSEPEPEPAHQSKRKKKNRGRRRRGRQADLGDTHHHEHHIVVSDIPSDKEEGEIEDEDNPPPVLLACSDAEDPDADPDADADADEVDDPDVEDDDDNDDLDPQPISLDAENADDDDPDPHLIPLDTHDIVRKMLRYTHVDTRGCCVPMVH